MEPFKLIRVQTFSWSYQEAYDTNIDGKIRWSLEPGSCNWQVSTMARCFASKLSRHNGICKMPIYATNAQMNNFYLFAYLTSYLNVESFK